MPAAGMTRHGLRSGVRSLARGLRLLRACAREAWAPIVGGVLALALHLACEFIGPLVVRHFIDGAIEGISGSWLLNIALLYLGISLAGMLASVLVGYLAAHAAWGVADALRLRLFTHTVSRPVLELERMSPGEVLEGVEGNADIIGRSIAEAGFRIVGNLALILGIVVVMIVLLPASGLAIAALVLIASMLLVRLSRHAARRWRSAREQRAAMFGAIGDGLSARDDALALGESSWVIEDARSRLVRLLAIERRAYVGGRSFWPLVQLFFALSFGIGFGLGLEMLSVGEISIGTLLLIYLYVDLLRGPLEDLSSQVDAVQRLVASLSMAMDALESDSAPPRPASQDIGRNSGDGGLPEGPLSVAFENVTFAYDDRPVLRDVSFAMPAGHCLGIVGRTGAGKSTIVNLLCGLVTPGEGRVLLGGVDATAISPGARATRLAVLSQRVHLFAGTLRDNITLFDSTIPDDEVSRVLTDLGAPVQEWPDGLDTKIGAGGRPISEGEAQLIGGARALIRSSGLLIIDEGTSRLDPETERTWSAVVEAARRQRTVIMVAHRRATLAGVDAVLVIDEGRVVMLSADVQAALDAATLVKTEVA